MNKTTGRLSHKNADVAAGGFLPRDKALKARSQELRTEATPQEQHLWYDFLRHSQPRFTRQRIIGEYIVDFYCHGAALVIELDGCQHYEPETIEYDEIRTAYLNSLGLQVLRFANYQVDGNFEGVCALIQERLNKQANPCPPAAATSF
jgi:very-short-patch-repair endonuclease